MAKSIEAVLRKYYNVFVANSGIEGLKEARRRTLDIIIIDVYMPGMDGLELCRQLRIDPILSDVPILFLTAMGRPQDRIAGFRAGADDYLTKPFDLEELRLRIKAILRRISRDKPEPSVTLKVRDLTLNRNSYQAYTSDRQVKLTPMEFDLLYHLMVNHDEVFTSNRLLQEVWDYPSDSGSPDLVRMHIKKLRDKIEANPSKPEFIITIPRRGYTVTS